MLTLHMHTKVELKSQMDPDGVPSVTMDSTTKQQECSASLWDFHTTMLTRSQVMEEQSILVKEKSSWMMFPALVQKTILLNAHSPLQATVDTRKMSVLSAFEQCKL